MLRNFGGDYQKAAQAYCGLEATFRTPDGRTATLVLADGFDDHWVRTPGSVDIVVGSVSDLDLELGEGEGADGFSLGGSVSAAVWEMDG